MSLSPPFPRSKALDHTSLALVKEDEPPKDDNNGTASSKYECNDANIAPTTHLPGNPAVGLDLGEVRDHLLNLLATPLLDQMHDKLWFMAQPASDNIDALNQNRVKRREIIAIDDAKLHLAWGYGRIYFQPVPAFLLNYDVWARYLHDGDVHRALAVGFLRSYALLVASPLDFALAKQAHLLPADSAFDWLAWTAFISHFRTIGDEHVAPRYRYGQLRLSWLKWTLRLFRLRGADSLWRHEVAYTSISDTVAKTTLPLLFVFAIASSLLSAMQVALAVPADSLWWSLADGPGLQHMARAFWVVSVALVLLLAASIVLIIIVPCAVYLWQVQWAIRHRPRTGSYYRP